MDCYFPVKIHRELIFKAPEKEFLILYVDGYADDQQVKPLFAWNFQGATVTLDSKEPPSIPVLVITQCEHRGLCRSGQNVGTSGDLQTYNTQTQVNLLTKPLSGYGLFLNWYCIYDDKESWPNGDPEIFFNSWLYSGSSQVGYYHKHCFDFREGNHSVSPSRWMVTSSGTFDSAKMEVGEEDTGGNDWLERYGGWFAGSRSGSWSVFMYVTGEWATWCGDDNCCDVRIRSEYIP